MVTEFAQKKKNTVNQDTYNNKPTVKKEKKERRGGEKSIYIYK